MLHGYLGVWDCGDPKWGVLPLHSGVPFCPLPELSWPKEFISFVFFFFYKNIKNHLLRVCKRVCEESALPCRRVGDQAWRVAR